LRQRFALVRLTEPFDGAPEGFRSANRASSHTSDVDLIDLRLALRDRGPELVAYALGRPPNKRLSSKRELKWGTKGSFAYVTSGPKRGLWYDHDTSEARKGGDLLELIMRRIVSGFPEAVRWARDWLGWPIEGPAPTDTKRDERRRAEAERLAKAEAERLDDERRRIAKAARIWARTLPIEGTVGERYLREARKIPVSTWPDCVRFDPLERAVVVSATDENGELRAVQLVRLTKAGEKIPEGGAKLLKESRGVFAGAAVRLPGAKQGPVLLAEGPETGLSVWASTGYETWIALGQLSKLDPPRSRIAILCRDDDDPKKTRGGRAGSLTKSIKEWRAEGLDIREAYPWPLRRRDKSDFNDLIKELGAESVRARIERLLSETVIAQRLVPLPEARETLDRRVAGFFAEAMGWSDGRAPVHAMGVTLGTGKTETAIRHAVATVRAMRERGDKRAIAFAVPEHKLSDEIAERLKALGVRVAIWRGREAYKPKSVTEQMCGNLEEVREAERVFADVEKEVCKQCSFYADCAYLSQKKLDADIWIIGHQLLTQDKLPKPIKPRGVAALIVDESPWSAGLFGHEGKGIEVPLDSLDPGVLPVSPLLDLGERLADLRQRLKIAIENEPDGPVCRSSLKALGFDADSGGVAYRLEWERKIDKGLWREREDNRTLGSMSALWRAVESLMRPFGPEQSGELRLDRNRDGARVLKVKGRKDIGEGWRVPTLLIDARLDEPLVRHYWPQLKVTARIEVKTPHMVVRQAPGRAYSKAMLAPLKKVASEKDGKVASEKDGKVASEKDEAREIASKRNREKLRAYILKLDREKRGDLLVVTNKSILEALRLPAHIKQAHFNAVAGRDEWKDVGTILTVGSPVPPPDSVERIAEALSGKVIERIPEWYERGDVDRLLRVEGGVQLVPTQADMHPDKIAESVRARISVGEVMQAIGRGRGVNRTADNPLEVIVLGDVALPIPVDEFISCPLQDLTPADFMLSAGGVAYEDASAAALAYPNLWPSAEAAKKAFQRQRSGTFSNEDITIGDCPAPRRLVRVSYQRAGSGQKVAFAWLDTRLNPDFRGAVERALGPLAFFELIEDEVAAPEPPVVVDLPVREAEAGGCIGPYRPPSPPVDLVMVRMSLRDGGVRLGALAAEIGVSPSHLSNAMHGRRKLKPDIKARLIELAATTPPIQGRLL